MAKFKVLRIPMNVSLSPDTIQRVNDIVEHGAFPSRSALVDEAIARFLAKNEKRLLSAPKK